MFVDVGEEIETNAALSEPVFFTPSVVVPSSDLVESHLGERTKGMSLHGRKKGRTKWRVFMFTSELVKL